MSRPPRDLPARLEGSFTVRAALDAGISESRLQRSDLRAPFRGVRVAVGEPDDLVGRCRAALMVLPEGAVFSHWSAIRLLALDLPRGEPSEQTIHVRLPPGRTARRAGVVVHGGRDDVAPEVVMRHALPVVTPARTWSDMAGSLGADELVVLGDGMLRRRDPATSLDALVTEVARMPPGRRGARRLRDALPYLRARTDSPMETRTRLVLVRGGLPCPEVNVPVVGRYGNFLALPDMTYREHRLAIEYDGDVHRTDRATWRRDIARREALQAEGWLVMTVTADDLVRRPDVLVARVRNALARRIAPR